MIRLIDHLHALGMSNREARDALNSGKVYYYDAPTGDAARLIDPAKVQVRMSAKRIILGRDFVVLHKDPSLAVVWKPSGLLSIGARGRAKDPNLISLMARLYKEAHPVHRLDEGTSGLMMVALESKAQKLLKEMFFEHSIDRRYLAIVRHPFPKVEKTYDSIFYRNRGDGKRGSLSGEDSDGDEPDGEDQEGKHAVTHVRLLETLKHDASLVEARLETGRTHQVRIHLAEAGYPILGDGLYGGQGIARASRRIALHSTYLGFKHPITGQRMTFEAPLADDLEQLRRYLNGERKFIHD